VAGVALLNAIPPPPQHQLRHEAPDVGDAIVRMMRGLVTRAAHGDTEAIEQLARIEQLAPVATSLAGRLAHDHKGYSYTELGAVLGTTRQAARQRAMNTRGGMWAAWGHPDAHQLFPGHSKRTCERCQR
jgi:hypothetical protein